MSFYDTKNAEMANVKASESFQRHSGECIVVEMKNRFEGKLRDKIQTMAINWRHYHDCRSMDSALRRIFMMARRSIDVAFDRINEN